MVRRQFAVDLTLWFTAGRLSSLTPPKTETLKLASTATVSASNVDFPDYGLSWLAI